MGWDWFYNRIQTTRNLNQPNSPQTPYCYRHSFESAVGGLFWTSKGWVQIPPKVGFKSLALNVFFSFFPTSESPGRSFSGFKPGLLFFFLVWVLVWLVCFFFMGSVLFSFFPGWHFSFLFFLEKYLLSPFFFFCTAVIRASPTVGFSFYFMGFSLT